MLYSGKTRGWRRCDSGPRGAARARRGYSETSNRSADADSIHRGQFCLGGCNPLWSAAPGACVPAPVCQNGAYTFKNNDRIVNATRYNGDPTMVDFTVDSGVALTTGGGELVLTLTQNGPTAAGTRISSTREVLYANMVARMRTSKFAGVVSTFITMSGVKDEIDWEFPGSNVNSGQTKFV